MSSRLPVSIKVPVTLAPILQMGYSLLKSMTLYNRRKIAASKGIP